MTDWILRAPCRGILDFAPRDDAWRTSTQLTAICLPLLPVCASCPFNRECLDWVRPRRSHFDGIAAGRIWLDGMVITSLHSERPNEAPARTSPCGTEAGARAVSGRARAAWQPPATPPPAAPNAALPDHRTNNPRRAPARRGHRDLEERARWTR
jgi:hypothetical protein